MSATIPPTGFLRLSQMLAIIPVSKSTWFEGVRAGRYPKPVKIGPRASGWRVREIVAFVEYLDNQESHQGIGR